MVTYDYDMDYTQCVDTKKKDIELNFLGWLDYLKIPTGRGLYTGRKEIEMTEYKVMAKPKNGKRFQCRACYSQPEEADHYANAIAKCLWTKEVKVIVTDDNGISNTLIYKKTC